MKKIFAANWKLFKSPKETKEFFQQWNETFGFDSAGSAPAKSPADGFEVVFFPPAISLEAATTAVKAVFAKSNYELNIGVQNVYSQAQGAFTGENSAQVAKELGCKYALIGHSERRAIFGETNELLADKIAFVQNIDLVPMFCIGETLAEREGGKTADVLKQQLSAGLKKADLKKPLVIAYEPVWAIGTGKVATIEQVRETHQQVFEMLGNLGFKAPILYGGSVKPDNAGSLIVLPHVDGFLVGGASLEVPSFQKICSAH